MDNVLIHQLTSSALVIFLINKLKNAKWFPLLKEESDKLNRIAAVLLSGAAAIGVHSTFDHTSGTLTITGLTVTGIAVAGWHWLNQYALTELAYQSIKKNGNGSTPAKT